LSKFLAGPLLWLLLTGDIPTAAQVHGLSAELRARADLPAHVIKVLQALPPTAHPMTQLTCAIMAMQTESKFAAAYQARGLLRTSTRPTLNLLLRLRLRASG